MIQLDFVLYRFVCDIATFTGLFTEDDEGRCIPDTAAFHCTWSRTPRSKHAAAAAAMTGTNARGLFVDGTDNIYFKALGSDMALTFSTVTHQCTVNSDEEVITFAIEPSQFSDGETLPIIARGTLDPGPYFDKPKKNYAIKLRDAAGQVTGKLLFSLFVHEMDNEDTSVPAAASQSNPTAPSPKSPLANGLESSRVSLHRNPARDRLLKTSPSTKSLSPSGRSLSAEHQQQHHSHPHTDSAKRTWEDRATQRLSPHTSPQPNGAINPRRAGSPPSPATTGTTSTVAAVPGHSSANSGRVVQSVDVQLERITVKSDGIDLEHPAPLLLGGDYNLKIRYGSYAYSTARCVCCNPKEVHYRGQQTCITLQPQPSTEKLRFSLWEDKKQVAGFSLDPAKFKSEPGAWKEYAIPFRYHPTGQKAALDVRVRRLMVPLDGSPAARHALSPASHRQPTMTTSATEPIAFPGDADVPRRLTYQAESAAAATQRASDVAQTPTATTTPPAALPLEPQPLVPPSGSSTEGICRRVPSPASSPRSVKSALPPTDSLGQNRAANRDHTPHRFQDGGIPDRSMHSGFRRDSVSGAEGSAARSHWEHTPLKERPPPLTQNLADLPADSRPPDDHERYISEVLARLNRQGRGMAHAPTSLMEEWMGWRDDRERSRCNSVTHSHARSNSVSSTGSRADSIASVVSRRASVPRATKSNAEHSLMRPFTPDASGYRSRRRSSPSPSARNPLV